MSETEHTPGPWRVNQGEGQGHRVHGGGQEIARASEVYMSRAVREANARLIAAAPELLQALIECLEWVEAGSDAWDLADAAISKATGGV